MGKKKQTAVRRNNTRDVPALSFRAEVVPTSIDAEARTFDVTWTTGARVKRGWFDQFWEELSLDPKHVRMGRLESGKAPLLNAHSSWSLRDVLGAVDSAQIENGKGVAKVRCAKEGIDENIDTIFRKVEDRIIQNVSVGYRVHKLEKTKEEVEDLPVRLATDWEPYEISLVPMGADAGAGVRADSSATTNPCEFIGLDQETRDMSDKVKDSTTPAPAATPTVERTIEVDHDAETATAVAAEKQRGISIRAVAKKLGTDDKLVQEHIGKNTTAEQFRAIAINAYERAAPVTVSDGARPSVELVDDARDKWMRGAENGILHRAGVTQIVALAAKQRGETVDLDPAEFMSLSFLDLAKASLRRAGKDPDTMRKLDIVGEALVMRGGGYQAVGDFPILLENTLHKTLLAKFAITEDTWPLFCKRGSVNDFRAHNRYRTGSIGVLPVVPEGAEYVNQTIPDGEKESITAGKRGSIVELTREALINDDMDAFSRVAMELGRAAKLTPEVAIYALLALNGNLGPDLRSGDSLFHANHSNIGAGVALTVAGLEADRILMASQQDVGANNYLTLRPKVLLVPIGLGGQARVINGAEFDTDDVGDTRTYRQPNKVLGLYSEIVDTARLSGTRRYSFADPATAAVLEVAFLDGQSEPFMENETGFRRDGVSWKVRLDFGVAGIGYRGATSDAGV